MMELVYDKIFPSAKKKFTLLKMSGCPDLTLNSLISVSDLTVFLLEWTKNKIWSQCKKKKKTLYHCSLKVLTVKKKEFPKCFQRFCDQRSQHWCLAPDMYLQSYQHTCKKILLPCVYTGHHFYKGYCSTDLLLYYIWLNCYLKSDLNSKLIIRLSVFVDLLWILTSFWSYHCLVPHSPPTSWQCNITQSDG